MKLFSTLKLQDKSTAALRGTFIFELMPPEAWVGLFFITIMRENLANRRVSSRISVNSCPIHAAFGVFLTNS